MQVSRETPYSGMFSFGGYSSRVVGNQKQVKITMVFEFDAAIDITPRQLYLEIQSRSSLALVSYDSLSVTEKNIGDGGGDPPKGRYIYLKGGGLHACGYWSNVGRHYSSVSCSTFGGNSKAYASSYRWAVSVSWYAPLIATKSTSYSYGDCSTVC